MSLRQLAGGLFDADEPLVVSFRCCDTIVTLQCRGVRRTKALRDAKTRMHALETTLNAFDETSAVTQLNRTGDVNNEHVALLVERGLEYRDRTEGVFDITNGTFEHDLKTYLRGNRDQPPRFNQSSQAGRRGSDAVTVDGSHVTTDRPLDLNGLAKGYIVDRTAATLNAIGRTGFVNGGGDISSPTGPVEVESPYGDDTGLTILDTTWNIATSAGYNRRRGETEHIYNPRHGRRRSPHDIVTAVAKRDTMEADALATTLAALSLDDALELVDGWPGAEALIVHSGVYHRSRDFEAHEATN